MKTKRIAIERLIESFECDAIILTSNGSATLVEGSDASEPSMVAKIKSKVTSMLGNNTIPPLPNVLTSTKTGTKISANLSSSDYKKLSLDDKVKKLSVMQNAAMNIKRIFDTIPTKDGQTKDEAFAIAYGFSPSDVETLKARYRNGLRSLEKAVKEALVDYVKQQKNLPSKKSASDAITKQDNTRENGEDDLLQQAQKVLDSNGSILRQQATLVKEATNSKTRTFTSIY